MHDDLIIKYFELCTDIPMHEIHEIAEGLKNGDNPRNAKAYLAREIVKLYHSEKESTSAEQAFENVFVKKGKPDDIKMNKAIFHPEGVGSRMIVDEQHPGIWSQ